MRAEKGHGHRTRLRCQSVIGQFAGGPEGQDAAKCEGELLGQGGKGIRATRCDDAFALTQGKRPKGGRPRGDRAGLGRRRAQPPHDPTIDQGFFEHQGSGDVDGCANACRRAAGGRCGPVTRFHCIDPPARQCQHDAALAAEVVERCREADPGLSSKVAHREVRLSPSQQMFGAIQDAGPDWCASLGCGARVALVLRHLNIYIMI